MKNKSLDPVAEWKLANRKLEEFTTALPNLCEATKRAAAARDAASETLDRVEGDALIGKADEAKVTAARTAFDTARTEHLKATAKEREAIDNIARLEQMLPGLTTAAYEARMLELRGPFETELLKLQKDLLAAKATNDRLRAMHAAALEEFPPVTLPGGGTPYP